ncbi:hypothetical protein F4808DRAFT_464113 [Astrocystis sublimbata]|nr:hypothetical protein F4808DRAFT_464113 [Astrocystis sublimbata]
MASAHNRVITQEEHDTIRAKILTKSPDFVIIRETPAADMRRAESLLGLEEGKLDQATLRFANGDEHCPACNRQYNTLDMITAALKIHNKEFIKNIMLSDNIIASSAGAAGNTRAPVCADCGQRGPGPFLYIATKYSYQD